LWRQEELRRVSFDREIDGGCYRRSEGYADFRREGYQNSYVCAEKVLVSGDPKTGKSPSSVTGNVGHIPARENIAPPCPFTGGGIMICQLQ
jgi:hypothetical protein